MHNAKGERWHMRADLNCSVLLLVIVLTSAPAMFAQPGPVGGPNGPGLGGPNRGGGFGGAAGGAITTPGYGADAFGQNPLSDYVTELGFISKYSRDLGKRWAKDVPGLLPLTEQIQSDILFLQQEWEKWGRKNPNAPGGPLEFDPYYRSLTSMSKALKDAKKLKGGELLPLVQNIAKDIRTKAENCRHSQDGLGKQILVTVHTVRGTNEVAGFEVFYAPMALLKFKREHNRFPRLSSPTIHKNLAPGYYAIWLKRGNSTNTHIAQLIGGAGQTHFAFDVMVPDQFAANR